MNSEFSNLTKLKLDSRDFIEEIHNKFSIFLNRNKNLDTEFSLPEFGFIFIPWTNSTISLFLKCQPKIIKINIIEIKNIWSKNHFKNM